MRGKNTLFSSTVILLVLCSPVFAYQQIIDLGTLGGSQSLANSINNSGQIVGYGYNTSGVATPCLFDSSGKGNNINLGSLGGVGQAYQINDSGQIAGYSYNSSGYYHACLFNTTANSIKKIGSIMPYFNSEAHAVNNNGIIVGRTKENGIWGATIFDPSGSGINTNIGGIVLGSNLQSGANFINDNDQIVGSDNSSGAFLIEKSGSSWSHKHLGALGGTSSAPWSINNEGQIVGQATIVSGDARACLFDPTGGKNNIDLGTLGGGMSFAFSINNRGQIVGEADFKACLFDPTGQGNNIDLNTLIDPALGWTLMKATSINDNGWIVGYGYNTHFSDGHAFLITPEPATLLLFGLGGLILRRRKSN